MAFAFLFPQSSQTPHANKDLLSRTAVSLGLILMEKGEKEKGTDNAEQKEANGQ